MEIKFNINIDDRIVSFIRRVFKKRSVKVGLVIAVIGSSLLVYAAVTKPNTFTAGTVISSSEVNANFDRLYQRANSFLPDGLTGTPLNDQLLDGTTLQYPVPANTHLLIFSVYKQSGFGTQELQDTSFVNYYRVGTNEDGITVGGSSMFNFYPTPLVFKAGTTLQTSTGQIAINGLLIDSSLSNITAVTSTITNASPYTVTANTTLYLSSAYCNDGTGSLKAGNISVASFLGGSLRSYIFKPALALPSGTVLTEGGCTSINITGYER